MIVSHIVACAENGVIGYQGKMPWHLKEDLRYFREKTMGHAIIMGRKTFESVGKPLPGRFSVVVSRTIPKADYGPTVKFVSSISEALKVCEGLSKEWKDEAFIIGGGELYKQTTDMVDKIYLTLIHQTFEGDTFYPEIKSGEFAVEEMQAHDDQPLPFSFLVYRRTGAGQASD
ncbi:MAG: dihydrofolate reductase [Oligoflexales bacterium]